MIHKFALSRKITWWSGKDVISFADPAECGTIVPDGNGFCWVITIERVYVGRRGMGVLTMRATRTYTSVRSAVRAMKKTWHQYCENKGRR